MANSNTDDRIELPSNTSIYKSRAWEIGIDEENNGYVTQYRDGESFTFSVAKEEVERYMAFQSKNSPPIPTPPDGTTDDVPVPNKWTGGNVGHTGGGIWCRIFQKDHGEKGHLEVMYNVKHHDGVTAGAYDNQNRWLGEIETIEVEADNPTEEDALDTAYYLIRQIDKGTYDGKISNLFETDQN